MLKLPLSKVLPLSVLDVLMHKLVKRYYNTNKYNEVYRCCDLTDFEKQAIDSYLSELPYNPQILDIGCGAGYPFDSYLMSKTNNLTGIDISKKQIERARKNIPQASYVQCDFLKYESSCRYDGIVLFYSLFHINRKNHIDVLKRLYNMLDKSGRILMTVRKEDSGPIKYKENFCGQPMLWSYYGWKDFKIMLKKVGFKYYVLGDEKDSGSKESHLWIVLSKKSMD